MGYKLLTKYAFTPELWSSKAAGIDVRAAYDLVIPKRKNCLCKLDLALKIPNDCYVRIAPRSGLALKFSIDVMAGVVDPDYTGNVGVVLFNHLKHRFFVKRGQKIAQLICEMIRSPELREIENFENSGRDGMVLVQQIKMRQYFNFD